MATRLNICRAALVSLLAWAAISRPLAAGDAPPPVEHFFAEPDIHHVEFSPGGQHLAFLTTLGTGKAGIALMSLATGKVEPLVGAKDAGIDFFSWKGDDRIVYGGDLGGNESHALRSISISKRRVVSLAESYRERYADRANWAAVVDWIQADPERILIVGNKEIGSFNTGVWMLNVRTGKRTIVESSEGRLDFHSLVADNQGRILARSFFEAGKLIFEVRADGTSRFVRVAEFPEDNAAWNFLHFAADNETLYLLVEADSDTPALHTLNVRTRELSAPLFRPAAGEITSIISSYDRSRLLGVTYLTDRAHYHWFDAARARLQAQIDASLPGMDNTIVSRTADERKLVVYSASDRDPGSYYLLELDVPRLTKVGKVNRHLDPANLRPMQPIQFTARDGLVLHGYLTRPAGFEDRPAPLIVNPHGGPFGIRDVWGFNAEVQFLASRGYAVLQINYRGSGGYGRNFQAAGKREWGGKMQDDLTDGVNWAIAQGIADPRRIAIYGASYGGFAALAGLTFTPELYRCGINYVGATDLALITSWGRRTGARGSELFYREWVGDNKDYLVSRSPVNFVERIRVPTLHAYGFNDPRVDIKHWRRLEPKLKQFNKPYEIIIESEEGHGFAHEQSRLRFYRKMEEFLAKHL